MGDAWGRGGGGLHVVFVCLDWLRIDVGWRFPQQQLAVNLRWVAVNWQWMATNRWRAVGHKEQAGVRGPGKLGRQKRLPEGPLVVSLNHSRQEISGCGRDQ